jgi:hypothetical protein
MIDQGVRLGHPELPQHSFDIEKRFVQIGHRPSHKSADWRLETGAPRADPPLPFRGKRVKNVLRRPFRAHPLTAAAQARGLERALVGVLIASGRPKGPGERVGSR